MSSPSPAENSYVFTTEDMDTSKRTIYTLRKTKVLRMMSNPERFLRKRHFLVVATREEELMFIWEHASANLVNEESTWEIDSGALFHIASSRECCSSYTTDDYGYVNIGDNGERKIVGIGSVCLRMSTGWQPTLRDVRHVPDIKLNLISTGRLDDEGYCGSFQIGKLNF